MGQVTLKEFFLGDWNGPGSGPMFEDIKELSDWIAHSDVPQNPYRRKPESCRRQIAALFRGDPRARISDGLYLTLCDVIMSYFAADVRVEAALKTLDAVVFPIRRLRYQATFEPSTESPTTGLRDLSVLWPLNGELFEPVADRIIQALARSPKLVVRLYSPKDQDAWQLISRKWKEIERTDEVRSLEERIQLFVCPDHVMLPLWFTDVESLDSRGFAIIPQGPKTVKLVELPPVLVDSARLVLKYLSAAKVKHPL